MDRSHTEMSILVIFFLLGGVIFFIFTMGSGGPQWGLVNLICMYVCISVHLFIYIYFSLSLFPVVSIDFWQS